MKIAIATVFFVLIGASIPSFASDEDVVPEKAHNGQVPLPSAGPKQDAAKPGVKYPEAVQSKMDSLTAATKRVASWKSEAYRDAVAKLNPADDAKRLLLDLAAANTPKRNLTFSIYEEALSYAKGSKRDQLNLSASRANEFALSMAQNPNGLFVLAVHEYALHYLTDRAGPNYGAKQARTLADHILADKNPIGMIQAFDKTFQAGLKTVPGDLRKARQSACAAIGFLGPDNDK